MKKEGQNLWEQDGSCWQRGIDGDEFGWRWIPMNWKAFAKGQPDSPVTDFYWPFSGGKKKAA